LEDIIMKAIGIVGSPRNDGNTVYLLKKTLDVLKQDSIQTEMVFLKDLDIRPCEGCKSCEEKKECKIEDDMKGLLMKLKESDVIILTSPSFMGGATSRTRAFMERTWLFRKGQLKDKIGASIVVGRRDIGITVSEMDAFFDRIQMVKVPGVIGYGFHKTDIHDDKEAIKKSEKLGNRIIEILKTMKKWR
jgi:multimeric flavodoxin WrbA